MADKLPKQTESRVIIRFQDCDPLQHLNNAKYFDYFFNARSDQVSTLYDYNPAEVFRKFNTGWVVYNHNISYIRPAFPGEWVRIFSRLLHFSEDTLLLEYYMTDDRQTQLKTMLWTTMVYIDMQTGKRTSHQEEVRQQLQRMVVDDFDPAYLQDEHPYTRQRIRELRTRLKANRQD